MLHVFLRLIHFLRLILVINNRIKMVNDYQYDFTKIYLTILIKNALLHFSPSDIIQLIITSINIAKLSHTN